MAVHSLMKKMRICDVAMAHRVKEAQQVLVMPPGGENRHYRYTSLFKADSH